MIDFDKFRDMDKFQSMEFDIMLRNKKVGYVKYDMDTGELITETYGKSIIDSPWHPDLKPDLKYIENFIESRCFERGRADKVDLLNIIGVWEYNPQNIVRKTKGIIQGDNFWLKFPEDNELKYEDLIRRDWPGKS